MREWILALRDDAEAWCDERDSVLFRAMLLAYLAYAFVRHVADGLYSDWFKGITLVFHEIGHIVFVAPRTLTILGGTLMQLIVPTAAATYLLVRQRDWFGFAVGGAWLSFSLYDVATYIADARTEALPLTGFSDHPEHDWSTLLTQWHVLNSAETIASLVRAVAFVVGAGSLALGAMLCLRIYRGARAR